MHHRPGEPLPHQPANAAQVHPFPKLLGSFNEKKMLPFHLCGLSFRFQKLSPRHGQVPYVFLTRSPLHPKMPFDLHVLGMPPAFILSQDQTLHLILTQRLSAFVFTFVIV